MCDKIGDDESHSYYLMHNYNNYIISITFSAIVKSIPT